MSIGAYIKQIGRGARGARGLTRAQASDLLGQVLDGRAGELEVGAFCVAMRIKGETAEEMCGFVDAAQARVARFPAGADGRPLIVLPSYNGARRLPVRTPLLALLLARAGQRVLLHGMRTEAGRVLSSDVLAALDLPALAAIKPIAPGEVAHVATPLLHPGLARLLATRETLGLRNPGHSVAKLLTPCAGPALLVTNYTHPAYFDTLCASCATLGLDALLSRGLEGEPAADPRRSPRHDAFIAGVHEVLDEQQPGTASEVPGLPSAIDTATTANYTRRVLVGELPVPAALQRQVDRIVELSARITTRMPS